MLRRVLPAAVENVGVNGYVSEHGIHQPNVTNLHTIFTIKGRFFFDFVQEGGQFRFKQKKNMEKIKSYETFLSFENISKNKSF